VAGMWDGRQRFETPERTERQLRRLVDGWGMDGLHFYDHNFFGGEAHCRELVGRLATLSLSWWCEARIDAMLRYSDDTWRMLRNSGLRMVYCGAESGSDASLIRMDKHLSVAQVEEFAARTKDFGIVPELSFCLGEPENPEEDVEATIPLIRRIMKINPATEIVLYYYTPTPHVGDSGDEAAATPSTLDEWLQPEWQSWSTHTDPQLPWLRPELRRRVRDFELVLRSRFPSVHDWRTPAWAKPVLKAAAWRRWRRGDFSDAHLLRSLRSRMRVPKHDSQAYGHLRGAKEGAS
jgi:anaerobic magnesium-protoporphyrin IX monomethyl ester cyclase